MPAKISVKVIDASALAALLFGEPEADRVLSQIQGGALVAPSLLPFEVASVCLKKLHRHPEKRDDILAAHALLAHMPIEEIDVSLNEVIVLAEQTGLTVYDAAYVWLAKTLRTDLITLDKAILRVFSKRKG